jgi:hypothetical protein
VRNLTQNKPSNQLIERLELESSAKFLAIKRCQWTKFGKVIKLAQSSIKKWVHVCAHHQSPGLISMMAEDNAEEGDGGDSE